MTIGVECTWSKLISVCLYKMKGEVHGEWSHGSDVMEVHLHQASYSRFSRQSYHIEWGGGGM